MISSYESVTWHIDNARGGQDFIQVQPAGYADSLA